MKADLYTKAILTLIAALLLINLANGALSARPALAEQEAPAIGRYQISSWASAIGTYGHHSGYYVLDTTTGKITDKHEEVHSVTPR